MKGVGCCRFTKGTGNKGIIFLLKSENPKKVILLLIKRIGQPYVTIISIQTFDKVLLKEKWWIYKLGTLIPLGFNTELNCHVFLEK